MANFNPDFKYDTLPDSNSNFINSELKNQKEINKTPELNKVKDYKIFQNVMQDAINIVSNQKFTPSYKLALIHAVTAKLPYEQRKEIREVVQRVLKFEETSKPKQGKPQAQPKPAPKSAQARASVGKSDNSALDKIEVEEIIKKPKDEIIHAFAKAAAQPGVDPMAVARKLVGTMMRLNTEAAQGKPAMAIRGADLRAAFEKAYAKYDGGNPAGVEKITRCMHDILAGVTSNQKVTLPLGPGKSMQMNKETLEIARASFPKEWADGASLDLNLRPIASFIKEYLEYSFIKEYLK